MLVSPTNTSALTTIRCRSRAVAGAGGPRNGLPYPVTQPRATRKLAQVLRQVSSRLSRLTNINRRHQKVGVLLLLRDGGEGGLGPTMRLPFPTGRRRTGVGPQSRPSVGAEGGKPSSSRSSRRRGRHGTGLARGAGSTTSSSWSNNKNSTRTLPGGGAVTAMLSRFAVDSVGRDIAHAREARRNMSDGNCCTEMRVPSSSSPQGPFDAGETRGVLFGLGARLGRYCREDRWL